MEDKLIANEKPREIESPRETENPRETEKPKTFSHLYFLNVKRKTMKAQKNETKIDNNKRKADQDRGSY